MLLSRFMCLGTLISWKTGSPRTFYHIECFISLLFTVFFPLFAKKESFLFPKIAYLFPRGCFCFTDTNQGRGHFEELWGHALMSAPT